MPIRKEIVGLKKEMIAWRRHLHAHPELGFHEHMTGDFVAEKLEAWGLRVHRGLGGTGVVGVLAGQQGDGPSVGLRAELDALPIAEKTGASWASRHDGVMHACGHDGHTAMLLGAAKHLSRSPAFGGTVTFIFQPSEEKGGGANVMIGDGLFEQHPMDSVWTLHNAPHLPCGMIAWTTGPAMSAVEDFDIEIQGTGGHAARPYVANDPIGIACRLQQELESLVRRSTDSYEEAMITVTRIRSGDSYNVIPSAATLSGTMRALDDSVMDRLRSALSRLCSGYETMFEAEIAVKQHLGYPVLVNRAENTALAAEVAAGVVGEDRIYGRHPPVMGSEDFAFMLRHKPGAQIWIGGGPPDGDGPQLHDPRYDFNDAALTIGTEFLVSLTERLAADGVG